MVIQTIEASLGTENKALAPFQTRRYDNKYTPITFGELNQVSPQMASAWGLFVQWLSGEKPNDADIAFTIRANEGVFDRIFGATLCRKDDQIGFMVGNKFYPVNFKKGVPEAPDGLEVGASFAMAKLNGYESVYFNVNIYVEAKSANVTYTVPVRLTEQAMDESSSNLNTFLKRDLKALRNALDEFPNLSGGLTLKLNQLDLGTYRVTGYRAVNAKHGVTYILDIEGQGGDIVYSLEPMGMLTMGESANIDKCSVWANYKLSSVLSLDPVITPEKPAELQVASMRKTKAGHVSVDVALIVDLAVADDYLDLSF